MNYQQIKAELRKAAALLDAGDVAGAADTIHAITGKGLTRADLDANLSPAQIKTLRDHAREAGKR